MRSAKKRPPMPRGVRIPLAFLSLFMTLQVVFLLQAGGSETNGLSLALALLFLVTLYQGHPLARQWACVIGIFMFLAGLLSWGALSAATQDPPPQVLLLSLTLLALPITIWIGLSRPASKRYFDLQCPHCYSFRSYPKSFLYNRIGCRKCKRDWQFREHQLDPDIFD